MKNVPPTISHRIAVIGGGIAGLAAAHRLAELNPSGQLVLLESGSRLGGVLQTVHHDGFQVEQSADNFITTIPWAVNLCRRLGLAEELMQTNPACRQTFVVRAGRLCKLPAGFLMMAPTRLWPLALTPILSPWGKVRTAAEYFIPPRKTDEDESMASFVRRRLGREALERLVEPLVSAVYAADLEQLSVEATLSRFREMERRHGSLIRAMRRQMVSGRKTESGARYSLFVTLRRGLSSLADAIAARLPPGAVRTRCPVRLLQRRPDGGWLLVLESGAVERSDAVILATPAHVSARLLEPLDRQLAGELAGIPHSGTAIVSVGYDRRQVGHPLNGMGAVVPAVERSPILACSFSSQKYAHRAPQGKVLLRVFVGGACRPDMLQLDDRQLRKRVLDELARLLHVQGEPVYCSIARWPNAMPQYHVGHKERVRRIEARAGRLPHLQLAGNAYHGVGIPDCIHSGEQAAERLFETPKEHDAPSGHGNPIP